MGAWLTAIGVALQVIGLAVTGVGISRTWSQFGDEPFWEFIADPARKTWRWIQTKVLRRHKTATGEAHIVMPAPSISARGRVGWGGLPDEVSDAISELDRRTRQLLERVQDAQEGLVDGLMALRSELDWVRKEVTEEVETLRDSDRQVATGGIRLEALGLFLIALGVVLQGFGSLSSESINGLG